MSDGGTPANSPSLTRAVAPATGTGRGAAVEKAPSMVLTTACPDTTGVVAAVSGFLAANKSLITEAQH
jgi:formyltetrahydrofolate deformylase